MISLLRQINLFMFFINLVMSKNERTIFIRHLPSASRNFVTIYKKISSKSDTVPVVDTQSVAPHQPPQIDSRPLSYSCSACLERFRSAISLLKHIHEAHFRRSTSEKNSHLVNVDTSKIRNLRKVEAPTGQLLKALLNPISSTSEVGEGKYQCRFCPFKFPSRSHLSVHYRCHNRFLNAETSGNLICGVCCRIFIKRSSLFAHFRSKHVKVNTPWLGVDVEKSFPVSCSICFKRFKDTYELERHLTMAHIRKCRLKCQICEKTFATKKELVIHDRSHTKVKPFGCELCSKHFVTKSNLTRHKSLKHGSEEEREVMLQKNQPKLSMATIATVSKAKRAHCPHCNRHFENNDNLKTHLKSRHSEMEHWAYQCPKCSVKFRFPSQLDHHMKTAKSHGLQQQQQQQQQQQLLQPQQPTSDVEHVQLPICDINQDSEEEPSETIDQNFVNLAELSAGEGRGIVNNFDVSRANVDQIDLFVGTSTPIFENLDLTEILDGSSQASRADDTGKLMCEKCSKTFGRQADLNRHLRIVHADGEDKLLCETCGKSFRWRHALVEHLRIHTGEKPYKCDSCDQCFTTSGNLSRHRRNAHSSKP